MPLLFAKDKPIFFIHIPKTGGSSIEAYMRKKGELYFYSDRAIPGLEVRPQHFHTEIYRTLLEPKLLKYSFSVVRDPLDRLKSEYKFRSHEPKRPWNWLNRLAGGNRKSVKLNNRRHLMSFDEWALRAISMYKINPMINGNHIRPQVDFISPGAKVFNFSHGLNNVFRWIDEVTETAAEPQGFHLKKSMDFEIKVSKSVLDMIHDFYAEDYKVFDRL